MFYGEWACQTEAQEDVVVVRRGEHCFEIHGHGGLAAPARLMSDLIGLGCEPISAWQRLLAQSSSCLEAENVWMESLVTNRWSELLVHWQGNGVLARAVAAWLETLHDMANADSPNPGSVGRLLAQVDSVLSRRSLVERAFHGARIVLVGPTNAGKSSLINRIVGYDRTLVFDQPGTTRDVVQSTTMIDGWPVRLSDTAGERADADTWLERSGQEKGRLHASRADLICRLFPLGSEPPKTWDDLRQWIQVRASEPRDDGRLDSSPREANSPETWILVSQCDRLPFDWSGDRKASDPSRGNLGTVPAASGGFDRGVDHPDSVPCLLTSAWDEAGLTDLWEAWKHWLGRDWPAEPVAVPLTQRQLDLLTSTRDHLEQLARFEAQVGTPVGAPSGAEGDTYYSQAVQALERVVDDASADEPSLPLSARGW
ncbi:MAG: 50S ribosome-binding GTPase [Planctomycetales bacterium]|nr:50S ribosome-binding GTPase [Planctomycetales bacterium]